MDAAQQQLDRLATAETHYPKSSGALRWFLWGYLPLICLVAFLPTGIVEGARSIIGIGFFVWLWLFGQQDIRALQRQAYETGVAEVTARVRAPEPQQSDQRSRWLGQSEVLHKGEQPLDSNRGLV